MAADRPSGSRGHGVPGGWLPEDAERMVRRAVAGAAVAPDGREVHGASMPAGPAEAAALRHAGEAGPAEDVAAAGVVASLARELAALAPAARVSRAETLVRDNERQIRKKLAEGVTAEAICAVFAGHGAPLSPRHLRRILRKLDDGQAADGRRGASRRAEGARAAPAAPSPGRRQAAGGAATGGGRPGSSGPEEEESPAGPARSADRQRDLFDGPSGGATG